MHKRTCSALGALRCRGKVRGFRGRSTQWQDRIGLWRSRRTDRCVSSSNVLFVRRHSARFLVLHLMPRYRVITRPPLVIASAFKR